MQAPNTGKVFYRSLEKGDPRMRLCHSTLVACLLGTGLFLGSSRSASADLITIDFGDLVLDPESYYNGADGAGGFVSGGAFFNNKYNAQYGVWSGWAYSNQTDVTTPGFMNQYSAYNLPHGGG